MKTKRVLLLAESPYLGGITTHLVTVARAFREDATFEVLLATLPGRRNDQTLISLAKGEGFTVYELQSRSSWDPRIMANLLRLVTSLSIDLVHTHNYRSTLLAAMASLPCPFLNTCHGPVAGNDARLRAWQWMELQVMRRRPIVAACSYHVANWLAHRGVQENRIRTVYNACASPHESRLDSPRRDNSLMVAYLGRLSDEKGLDVLVQALGRTPGVEGMMVGEGPKRHALEALARSCGARLTFYGATPTPWDYGAGADVVILPSRMEALPMVLIEAAARGMPCIATRVGGVPEVVLDQETGLLIPPDSVDALVEAMEAMQDRTLREAMGARAREVWRERFSLERLRESLTSVYREALDAESSRT